MLHFVHAVSITGCRTDFDDYDIHRTGTGRRMVANDEEELLIHVCILILSQLSVH